MKTERPKMLTLNGEKIPARHYERMRRLYAMAFGLTDVSVPEPEARKHAMAAAIAAQSAMFIELRHRKALGGDDE